MTGRNASSLRAALTTHQPGRGKRYPRELKARIIDHARARRGAGASWAHIAEELGLAFETVRRWCKATESRSSRSLVPVLVSEADERAVSVVSPAGHRIEGLTLQQAVAVLRALG